MLSLYQYESTDRIENANRGAFDRTSTERTLMFERIDEESVHSVISAEFVSENLRIAFHDRRRLFGEPLRLEM